jgi:hypothetical protein
MGQEDRTEGFRIGCVHGKLVPDEKSVEAHLRNGLFLIGMLEAQLTRSKFEKIRLVAYEIPLMGKQARGECIDLLGYDSNKVPWIIELKKSDSNEKLPKVADQVLRYKKRFEKVREGVEKEIRDKYFWPEFGFSEGTKTMILAPRSFYKDQPPKTCEKIKAERIYCCSLAGIREEDLTVKKWVKNHGSHGMVRLKVENKEDFLGKG